MVKFNRFDNSTEVNLSDGQRSDGDFNNHGLGASLEFGRNIPLSDGYFIEPYTQWSVVSIEGASYSLDNGLRVKGGDTRSLLGKAGATVGRNFDLGNGHVAQPYVRLAYAHEFATNNDAKVNDHQFDSDLAGSRGSWALASPYRWLSAGSCMPTLTTATVSGSSSLGALTSVCTTAGDTEQGKALLSLFWDCGRACIMLNAQGWFTKLRTWLKVMVRSSDGRRGLSIDKTPRVPQMLENVPGGQMNLLPVSALKDQGIRL